MDSILHEHGNRQEAYAARYRCNCPGNLFDLLEIHITCKLLRCNAVDAYIDDGCPGFTISAVTKCGLPMAATRISASRVIEARSFVWE